jgi:hypothetical protein
MFFYVKPDFRSLTGKFIKETEGILVSMEVKQIVISNPAGNQHGRFYQMNGFRELETHYIKEVSCA